MELAMVLLKGFINKDDTLSLIEAGEVESVLRPYLGMSGLGHPCSRYLWYSFRWYYKEMLSRRIIRLFARGHKEEEVVIAELERIGIKCHSFQLEVVDAYGHSQGHNDGCCDNVPEAPKTTHLLEIKTMNDKSFKDLQKKKLKEAKPVYWAQVQVYMRKLKLTRTLFVAANKNDDQLYIERVRLDKDLADMLLDKACTIVTSMTPPEKTFQSTWYECKFCSARGVCHENEIPIKSCRSCLHIDLADNGLWLCGKTDEYLTTDEQRAACDKYTLL